ncbi:MAG: hypothetical protein KTR17_04805 [Cellvibrionaceae bacterium]|nr:hypothetical protein [Cellvibrionaceae bacterium]
MELNYQLVKQSESFTFDICIMGAGAAGIICASELRQKLPELKICLIDSGDFSIKNPHNHSLRKLEFSDLEIKKNSREFTLGGATNTWGGVTASFEEFETQGRPFLERSDWVIPIDKLKTFYKTAIEKYAFINTLESHKSEHPMFSHFTRRPFKAYSDAINYAKYLRNDINLIYNAHITGLHSAPMRHCVSHIEIENIESRVISKVYASRFILALGTIETIKLLLNAQQKQTFVVKNELKWLGRYFMNHPKGDYGSIEFHKYEEVNEFVGMGQHGLYQYTGISLPLEKQRNLELLNSYIRLEPVYSWRNDYLVAQFINFLLENKWVKKLFFRIYKNKKINMLDYSETGDSDQGQNLRKHSLMKSLKFLSLYLWHRLSNTKPKITTYKLRNFLEMEPRYNNRVTLSEKQDKFGNQQAKIQCSLSERDKNSVIELHRALRRYLEENKLGVLYSQLDQESQWPIADDASHHIGGTIMGASADDSFVDQNLRVHSQENLYICSSSVFPTSGSHNPTFTIAALACLLAEHIAEDLNSGTAAASQNDHKNPSFNSQTRRGENVAAQEEQPSELVSH